MLKAKFYYYNSEELNYAITKFNEFSNIVTITNVNEYNEANPYDSFVISATFTEWIDIDFLRFLTKPTKIEEIEE